MTERETAHGSGSADPHEVVGACAEAFVQAVIRRLNDERGVHIETALTAAGATAGSLLLRATGLDLSGLTPGSAVFGTGVDEAGPEMLGFLAGACAREGIDPSSGWAGPVGDAHAPLVPAIDLVRDLRPDFERLVAEHRVPDALQPHVALAAGARLLRLASGAIDADQGKAILAGAFVVGSKSVPHPLGV